jgi:hypothetical protein
MAESNAKRLFFGNPTKTISMKPLPKGERKAFGEPGIEPAKNPMLPPGAVVLCYGNSPVQPQNDVPFKVVNDRPVWPEKPKN